MIEVETSVVIHAGEPRVLLQLPYGHIVVRPEDARQIAAQLTMTAEDAERSLL